ncbi:hypothetical protein SEA_GAIL_64 [Mycobacterium phage Gail]|uniref:Uncharacterized protein n=1 Tax=Mycobacterium phage Gail TaxID=2743994 RepID=A0A7D5FTI1_9CAUD|nr:hypothetical protein KNV16_gp045 [Mycobacterium phage Gail]QLF84628.1 hypothetical protein SEA_GAIL_64 [Mycobacterium phage Gail]
MVVAGYIALAGLLTWFCLVADSREEAERGTETPSTSGAETLG